MSLKKFRWSQVYESSEEELVAFLQARGITSERIHMAADSEQTEQHAEAATTIWCAEGSLTIDAGAANTSMQPGDALRLDVNMIYVIHPGFAGCAYYLSTHIL